MVTPLDLGILERFSAIFVFLLIYAVILGGLSYSKVIENVVLRNIIALFIALLTIFLPGLVKLVMFIGPWIAVFMLLIVLLLVGLKLIGATDDDIVKGYREKSITWWIIIIFLVILLAGIGKVYFGSGEFLEKTRTTEAGEIEGIEGTAERGELQFWQTLFHPNVLGMLIVLLIAALAVGLIGSETPPTK